MAVAPFGFSVGDFIAAIELVKTCIDGIQHSSQAATEYNEVYSRLRRLERVVVIVKDLQMADELLSERQTLREVVSACQAAILDFLHSIEAYTPHFRVGGSLGLQLLAKLK